MKKWKDIRNKNFTPEQLAELDERVKKELIPHGFLRTPPDKVIHNGRAWEVEEIIVRNYRPFMLLKDEVELDPEYHDPGRNPIKLKLIDPFNDNWFPDTPDNQRIRDVIRHHYREIKRLEEYLSDKKDEYLDYDS